MVLVAAAATAAVGSVAALLGGLADGRPAVAGALTGVVMVVAFFGLGALVIDTAAALAPATSLLVALLTYTLKVVLLGAAFVALRSSGVLEDSLDARWLGGTVILGTLTWLTTQLAASVRRRQPLYDLPSEEAAGRPAEGDDRPCEGQEAGAR